ACPRTFLIDTRTHPNEGLKNRRPFWPAIRRQPERGSYMRARAVGSMLVAMSIVVPLTIRADFDDRGPRDDRDCPDSDHHEHHVTTPVRLLGVIAVPGNPIMSTDIGWVDRGTERFYLADRSNFGVDIIDAEDNFYVDRVGGMAGPKPSGGGTSTTNGP